MSEITYQIVGSDSKIYGPATAEHVRQWLTEGRVNGRSPVLVSGAPSWTTIGALPEFSATPPPPKPAAPPTPSPTFSPASVVYVTKPNHPLATAGLVCGILSICFCCGCCFPVDLLGLIFSLIALVQISENPDRYTGRSMAIVGLVLSIVSFLFFLVSLATNHYNNNQFHYNIDNFRNF